MSNDAAIPKIAEPAQFSPCVTCRHWFCTDNDRSERVGILRATLREDGYLRDDRGKAYGAVDGLCRLNQTSVPKPSDGSCANHSRTLSDAAYWLMEIYNLLSRRM